MQADNTLDKQYMILTLQRQWLGVQWCRVMCSSQIKLSCARTQQRPQRRIVRPNNVRTIPVAVPTPVLRQPIYAHTFRMLRLHP